MWCARQRAARQHAVLLPRVRACCDIRTVQHSTTARAAHTHTQCSQRADAPHVEQASVVAACLVGATRPETHAKQLTEQMFLLRAAASDCCAAAPVTCACVQVPAAVWPAPLEGHDAEALLRALPAGLLSATHRVQPPWRQRHVRGAVALPLHRLFLRVHTRVPGIPHLP